VNTQPTTEPPADRIVVRSEPTGLATTGRIRAHNVRTDEPPSLGGADSAPSPVELCLTALAACAVTTARMYAQRKGWPLVRAEAAVARPAAPGGAIGLTLTLEGPLDDDQRRRIFEIADRCPVHKMLAEATPIESRLAPA
jgi:putative redox protein